jgi:surfeit locus 1 family protein
VTGARFWVVTLAAVLGIAGTASLGFWQLGRAHEKEAYAEAIASRRGLPPVGADQVLGPARAALVHRPVRLRGQWLADHTVFLDNRQMSGRVGFYVATPLRLAGSERVILVQRGWAPRDFVRRERLPTVETPAGEVEVTGRMAPPPAKLYQLGTAGAGPIRQNLDLGAFASEQGLDLLPDVSVQELGPASQGLLRDWSEAVARGPETNYGYAFQWWALSGLLAILYAWFQFIQPRRRQA